MYVPVPWSVQSADCPSCEGPQADPESDGCQSSEISGEGAEERHTAHGPVEAQPPRLEQQPPVDGIHIVVGQCLGCEIHVQHEWQYILRQCICTYCGTVQQVIFGG